MRFKNVNEICEHRNWIDGTDLFVLDLACPQGRGCMNNSGGGGRAGRGPALNRLVEGAKRKRQYQKTAYDQHEYDGCDPDMEAEPA